MPKKVETKRVTGDRHVVRINDLEAAALANVLQTGMMRFYDMSNDTSLSDVARKALRRDAVIAAQACSAFYKLTGKSSAFIREVVLPDDLACYVNFWIED